MDNWKLVNIKSLKLNDKNPRTIKDSRFDELVKSIQDFPKMLELRPIVVNGQGMVLGGNMRLKAALKANLKKVPVIQAKDLTEAQQREFIIKDNVGFGDWDWPEIIQAWPEAPEWGLEIPDFPNNGEVKEDDYEIPDEIETDIQLGDLFEIGPHRLLCGDSTKGEDVERLLSGKEPYLMVTDPPYGVNYEAGWRNEAMPQKNSPYRWKDGMGRAIGKVNNDDRVDWSPSWALSPSRVAYVWHGGRHAAEVQSSLESADFAIRCQIVWVKNNIVISRGDYHWKHEPCWYAVKKGSKGNWASDRKQTTVWEIDKPMKSETGHSAQKPVECMARPIRNHDGDVYDPFIGSGTTMVAAHQLNRKCYGMEIDPKYCQVVIDRMKKLDPEIVIKKMA